MTRFIWGRRNKIPHTGATISKFNYDDAYNDGMAIDSEGRFTDNGDNTITDNLYGLMWINDITLDEVLWPLHPNYGGEAGATNMGGILSYAHNLSYKGYSDWRVPSAAESHSLVGASMYGALPAPFAEIGSNTTELTSTFVNAFAVWFSVRYDAGDMFGAITENQAPNDVGGMTRLVRTI